MATSIVINGVTTRRPGVYSSITSGQSNPSPALSSGNICIIDTGMGSGFPAGAGINGTLTNGRKAIKELNTIDEYQSYIKGGYLWLIGNPLFYPAGPPKNGTSINGVSKVFYIKAATTVNANIAFAFINGSATIQTLDEGTGANGVLSTVQGNLQTGYGIKLIPGVQDPTKFIFQFYVGTFKGFDTQNNNRPYDGISNETAVPDLICQTPEILTVQDFVNFCNTDGTFNSWFKLSSSSTSSAPGTGATATALLTGNSVSSIVVNTHGTGYLNITGVKLVGGGGTGATAVPTIRSVVSNIDITNGGSGYTVAPTISFSGGGGTGAAAHTNAMSVGAVATGTMTMSIAGIANGNTVSFEDTNTFHIYASYTFNSSTDTTDALFATHAAAAFNADTVNNNGWSASATGAVITFTAPSFGSSFNGTSIFSFFVSPGNIIDTMTVAGGADVIDTVTSITITNGGTGYTSTPTVIFSSGAAAATATIETSEILSVAVTAGGTGYTSPPTVQFTLGGVNIPDIVEGQLLAPDISTYAGYNLAIGGTESYSSSDFSAVLAKMKDISNTFFLCTDYGPTAQSANNAALQSFVDTQVKYNKFLVVGGGNDSTLLYGADNAGSSYQSALFFDDENVTVVHGGVLKAAQGVPGFLTYDSFYKAAEYLGRTCGLDPQVPITMKWFNIDGEVHLLEDEDQEFCLKNGIMYSYFDTSLSSFVFGEGINTLQDNNYLVNDNGSSFSNQVMRIISQLNMEIVQYATQAFFGKEKGPNRATITDQDIIAWLRGYLSSRTADGTQDNLIIRVGQITVVIDQDIYRVNYEFVPNFEISKIIFTGFILQS